MVRTEERADAGARRRVREAVIVRVARWSATHPWRAIATWLLVVTVSVVVGAVLGTNPAKSADYRVGEAGRAESIAAQAGLTPPAEESVLVVSRSGRLDRADTDAAVRDVTVRLEAQAGVAKVNRPERADDGRAVRLPVILRGDDRDAKEQVEALQDAVAAGARGHQEVRVELTGDASIGHGNDVQRGADLQRAESVTLPLTLVILLVAFGAVLAASVPVLLALGSVAAAMGLSAVVSHLVPDPGVGSSVILLMGMAVGVDYALFYLRREREERANSGGRLGHVAAVEVAAATSGHAVVVSGGAVMLSTACLYAAGDIIFSSLATGAIVVVLIAVVSSVTVLPAVLAKLGRWIDRLRLPLLGRFGRADGDSRFWQAALRPAVRRPLVTLVASAAVLVGLAIPAVGMTLNVEGNNTFSSRIPAVATYHRMLEHFPDQRAAHLVVVRGPATAATDVHRALHSAAKRVPGATATDLHTSADRKVTTLEVAVPYDSNSDRAVSSLRQLRDDTLPATVGRLAGAEYLVSGDVARDVDYVENQATKTPLVVGLVLLLTFLMMAVAFRSVVAAAVGVVLNLLSAGAALGALVGVFQYGWLDFLPFVEAPGFVGSRVPLFLFVILFGLAMDYQIFVLSRIRERVQRGVPTREAVRDGVASSAGVVTSAAVVMMSVFVSFVFLTLVEMKQMGFVLAFGVFLDAFVVRVVVLPAALSLLGRATWWPSSLFHGEVRSS